MRHSPTLFTSVLLLLFLGGIHVVRGDDKPASKDLGKIQPPGGVPLPVVGPEGRYTVDGLKKVRKRLEAVPKEDLEKWVVELERIMDKKLQDGVPSASFVIHLSVAFDDLKWNAKTADNLFKRAQTMPAAEARVWKEAFEALLKKEIGQMDTTNYAGGPAWAVPLVLIPVDALHEGQKYSAERGKKYLARLKQLTADDVSLWKDKVDEFGGTQLDAAVNIILLDDYFDKEKFQRDKFKAAIGARPVQSGAGPPGKGKAAAAAGFAPAETLEDVAAWLKINVAGVEIDFRPLKAGNRFESRREIVVKSRNWDKTPWSLFVVPALPADKIGDRPTDYRGALAVAVIATDGRYTVVAGTDYDPEVASKILMALGQTLSKEAEKKRLSYSLANWLDFRLAAPRDSDRKREPPQPLADGPTRVQIEDYTRLFVDKGYNGGRRRGDPYLWFPVLGCCEVSPLLATTADRAASYLLLSDKPDEVMLSGSKRPRPWHLKRVRAVRDAQGQAAVELEFDVVASARMARLIDANPGRALALVFSDRVLQIQIIDGKRRDKLVISGKAFDEKAVAGMVRALRECMLEPVADANSGANDAPVELKAVEQSLKPILESLDPKAKVEYRDKSLVVTFLPQSFKIHGRTKSGAIDEKAHDEIGPSNEGFVLKAHLQPRGEVNQAIVPQTIRQPYWLTDLDVTPIAKTDKQLYWALLYGSRTDQELLNTIRGKLKALKESPANR